MIRILTGTLLDAGLKKVPPKQIKKILLQRDRRLAGKTLPPHALFLVKALYEEYNPPENLFLLPF